MRGLDSRIPLREAALCVLLGMAGTNPAMTKGGDYGNAFKCRIGRPGAIACAAATMALASMP